MATTSTDPRDIEADLERERASLANTLDALSDRVSVDNLAREALGMLRSHAGTATVTLDHAVRANPIAVALIGAGVAYMFLGPRIRGSSSSTKSRAKVQDYSSGYQSSSSGSDSQPSSYTSSSYGTTGYQASGYAGSAGVPNSGYQGASGDALGSSSPSYMSSSYAGTTGEGANGSSGTSDYGRVGYVASDNDDEDHAWSREAHGLRARAADALRRIEDEAKSYYDSLRRGISGGVSNTRDFAAERASVIAGFTSDLRTRLSSGLDNLPPEARERVVAARERAYGAMLQAERMGREVWQNPTRTMEDHPIVAGAVGFALGAAVAALLPSTEVENRTFGAERDRLMDEAARLLRQERERAVQIAGELGQEIKSAAQETVGAVSETVANKASEAAHRVTDLASDELRNAAGGTSSGSGAGSRLGGPGDPVIG
jgi:ElaB/YqjD/DUF883 family membrane-anchored ribosome-binding protein